MSDSTIQYLKDGSKVPVNPFRSRSTVIALSCISALLGIVWMTIKAGYYNDTFAGACLMLLTNIVYAFTNHQRETDKMKQDQEKQPPSKP